MKKNRILFNTRFFLRKIIHKKNYIELEKILDQYKDLARFFDYSPKHANDMLCKSYGSLDFNSIQSFVCFKRDLALITSKFPNIFMESKVLYEYENIKIIIHASPRVISEGLFSLALIYKGTTLYTVSFVLLSDAVLITAIQGGLNIKDTMKEFTKEYYGLRPLNFVIFLIFKFADLLEFNYVCGIKDKFMVSNFKRNRKRNGRTYIIPNYDDIWRENTEIISDLKSYYELKYIQKDLEEIPSKKRSMYKKRYEFLENIKF